MVELVDTTDLNSVDPNGSCGFKSRSGRWFCNAELQGFVSGFSHESPLGWVCLPHLKLDHALCSLFCFGVALDRVSNNQSCCGVSEVEQPESGLFEMMQGSFDSKAQAAETRPITPFLAHVSDLA